MNIMSCLNPGTFPKHRPSGQDQISKTMQHRPNILMDFVGRIKFQGPFGINQMSLWTF